jgi:hypothetical protein
LGRADAGEKIIESSRFIDHLLDHPTSLDICGANHARSSPIVESDSGVQLVVSGHQHAWHIIEPCDGLPMQVIGGGNEPYNATLIVLEADATSLRVVIQDIAGTELARRQLTRS